MSCVVPNTGYSEVRGRFDGKPASELRARFLDAMSPVGLFGGEAIVAAQ